VHKTSSDKIPLLIVEPDPLSTRLLQVTLAEENYDIDVATTGREALSKIIARPPVVLLLELALPDMNGVDLITTLKAAASTRDIVVIVVTSRNGHATEAELLRSLCSKAYRPTRLSDASGSQAGALTRTLGSEDGAGGKRGAERR
jgi:CheY-like chemotaxis protein